jgi:hypothetical protein
MASKDNPYYVAYPPVALTNVTVTPQTFKVDCGAADTLILDFAHTHVAGTQLNLSFSRLSPNDATNQYTYLTTTYGPNTIANTPFTFPLSASGFYTVAINLSSLPLAAASSSSLTCGPITVSISLTGGTTDSLTVTPIVGVLS